MGTRVAQFDFLLAGYVDPATGVPGAGYTAYFYAAGTTTAKDVWTVYDKSTAAVQSVLLDSTGSAAIWGDGVYKVVIKDTTGATVDTFDGVKVQAGGYNVTTSSAATVAVTVDMDAVLLDCTSTDQVATLPLAATALRPIFFKRIAGGANTISIVPSGSDTIDGAASYPGLTTQNADVTFVSDGANWYGANSGSQNADTVGGYGPDTSATAGTIAIRGTDGVLAIGDGVLDGDAATVGQVSAALGGYLPDDTATVSTIAVRTSWGSLKAVGAAEDDDCTTFYQTKNYKSISGNIGGSGFALGGGGSRVVQSISIYVAFNESLYLRGVYANLVEVLATSTALRIAVDIGGTQKYITTTNTPAVAMATLLHNSAGFVQINIRLYNSSGGSLNVDPLSGWLIDIYKVVS